MYSVLDEEINVKNAFAVIYFGQFHFKRKLLVINTPFEYF